MTAVASTTSKEMSTKWAHLDLSSGDRVFFFWGRIAIRRHRGVFRLAGPTRALPDFSFKTLVYASNGIPSWVEHRCWEGGEAFALKKAKEDVEYYSACDAVIDLAEGLAKLVAKAKRTQQG